MKASPTPLNRPDSFWYLLVTIIFVSIILLSGYGIIRQQKQLLLDVKYKELSTIADIKASQLVQWRKERIAEGASIRANAMMAHRIKDYISGTDRTKVRLELQRWMANLIEFGGYSRVIIFSADAAVIASDSNLQTPPSQHYISNVVKAVRDQEIILSDFHKDNGGASYDIDLTVPIMFFDGINYRCIAVVTLDIGPAKRLYKIITSWPTTSLTAETLLVRREGESVLFLNDPRYSSRTGNPLLHSLANSTMPEVRAALGEEGNFEGVDYRHVPVLSSIRNIPGTRWGVVAKIDVSEVLLPLKESILVVSFVGIVLVVTMIMGLFLWGLRRKAESLRKLVEAQKAAELKLHEAHSKLELQIYERTRDLLESNVLLRSEIAERKQLEQQLLSAKRLEAIGQIAGGVAHEVRNPLNAILTITEALFKEKEIEGNPEYEPFIHHIRTQVNRLVNLMNDLLDLGRTIPVANLQAIPLYAVCRETLDLWKSTGMSKNKQILLNSDTEMSSTLVFADALKLQQVLFNLFENAGYHSPDNKPIVVQLTHNSSTPPDNVAVIQVIDQGPGIAADRLPRVFDPFYTDRKGGTGLGLALVKHFIENMNGTVRMWNNNPPPGCTVEIRIPLFQEEL
ncbi:MAG: ATP-binding protein [Desulfuromonadaceae bacterium]|nr:ATP-binding protein [Desulfuromonadaceae bacterium]